MDDDFDALQAVRTLIRYIGDDPDRPGVIDTPRRFLKAWKQSWGRGYADPPPQCTCFEEEWHDEMVIVKGITYFSHCEHHLAPFFGTVTIGYVPDKNGIVGLSKLARVTSHFAQRLQVQERMTKQIAEYVFEKVSQVGVGVIVKGTHLCMVSRGVCQPSTETITSALRGDFFNDKNTRAEFLKLGGVSP